MHSSRPHGGSATLQYVTAEESIVPLFTSLPAPARGLDNDRAAAVYLRIMPWDRGVKTHHSTAIRDRHRENTRDFAQTLHHLYTTFTAPL